MCEEKQSDFESNIHELIDHCLRDTQTTRISIIFESNNDKKYLLRSKSIIQVDHRVSNVKQANNRALTVDFVPEFCLGLCADVTEHNKFTVSSLEPFRVTQKLQMSTTYGCRKS